MKKLTTTTEAIEQFIEAASKHAALTETGDYKASNLAYKKIDAIVSYLKDNNELDLLSGLLKHASIGVRIWSAGYLLSIKESEAINTLKDISNTSGIHSLTAQTIIEEWLRGEIKK